VSYSIALCTPQTGLKVCALVLGRDCMSRIGARHYKRFCHNSCSDENVSEISEDRKFLLVALKSDLRCLSLSAAGKLKRGLIFLPRSRTLSPIISSTGSLLAGNTNFRTENDSLERISSSLRGPVQERAVKGTSSFQFQYQGTRSPDSACQEDPHLHHRGCTLLPDTRPDQDGVLSSWPQ
jgi:hypothetical protein